MASHSSTSSAEGGYHDHPGPLPFGTRFGKVRSARVNFVEVLGPADRHLSSLMQIAVLVFIACYGLVSLEEILVGWTWRSSWESSTAIHISEWIKIKIESSRC